MLNYLKRLYARPFAPLALAALVAVPIAGFMSEVGVGRAAEPAVTIPAPAMDSTAMGAGLETAIVAGGCFWGVQAVYQHVDGVEIAISGYSGGTVDNPSYEAVTTGTTSHAESVQIKFDPKKVSYGKILQIFFSVAHNPTQLNYQGPDHGTQYRSAIFYTNDEQKKVAEAYIGQLGTAKVFADPIVTEVTAAATFYPAEGYHQDYATLHPDSMYIVINDAPKVVNLQTMFPDLFRAQPMLVMGKAS